MKLEASHVLELIRANWTTPAADEVIPIIHNYVMGGAKFKVIYPIIRELKVVLPRRLEAVRQAGLGYRGISEIMEAIASYKNDDMKLLCFYLDEEKYLFMTYFTEVNMDFLGCIYGHKRP
jgi:hypothetical protein